MEWKIQGPTPLWKEKLRWQWYILSRGRGVNSAPAPDRAYGADLHLFDEWCKQPSIFRHVGPCQAFYRSCLRLVLPPLFPFYLFNFMKWSRSYSSGWIHIYCSSWFTGTRPRFSSRRLELICAVLCEFACSRTTFEIWLPFSWSTPPVLFSMQMPIGNWKLVICIT